jgi:hypothetical protein
MASSVEVQEKRAELRRLVEEVNSDWDWKKVQRAQYLSAWFKENGISVEEEQNTAAIVDSKSSRVCVNFLCALPTLVRSRWAKGRLWTALWLCLCVCVCLIYLSFSLVVQVVRKLPCL